MKNGEKYVTAQERAEAFKIFCCGKSAVTNETCNLKDDCNKCAFAWLDIEAEEEKPLPCPFCGGETEAHNCVGGWCVQCDCGYSSKQFNKGNDDEVLKAEAIAAHYRVAKAVKEREARHD